jgi:hypothetical protein
MVFDQVTAGDKIDITWNTDVTVSVGSFIELSPHLISTNGRSSLARQADEASAYCWISMQRPFARPLSVLPPRSACSRSTFTWNFEGY